MREDVMDNSQGCKSKWQQVSEKMFKLPSGSDEGKWENNEIPREHPLV